MSRIRLLLILLGCCAASHLTAQPVVNVTMSLDTNRVTVGGSTMLHVYAQVAPAFRSSSERIFSWYVDVLNNNGAAATANYNALTKPGSDNSPDNSSSKGVTQVANRRGIYDTFTDINVTGIGVNSPVELMRIPVTGVAPGTARFSTQAGTGVANLSSDFLVAPIGGVVPPFSGGIYTAAFADLQVVSGGACNVHITITPLTLNGGPGGQLRLDYNLCPGRNHFVEFTSTLSTGWQALPGGPHNSGSVTVVNNASPRFYRVRVD